MRSPPFSLTVAWWTAGALFAAAITGWAATSIVADRAGAVRDAEIRSASLSRIFLDHAERALEDAEKLLLAIRPLVAAWDHRDVAQGQRIFDERRRFLIGSPQLASAWIVDGTGATSLDTWSYPSRPADARSRLTSRPTLPALPIR